MLLYDSANPAPNPRRVRMFLAEKGIDVPRQDVSIPKREQKDPAYLAVNPLGQTPTLVLDDGTAITESVAICRYFEAAHPEPALFGNAPEEQATVEMWTRRVELRLMMPVSQVWIHVHPFTARLPIRRFADYGETQRDRAVATMAEFDGLMRPGAWLAGERYTMADIVLLSVIDFAGFIGIPLPDDLPRLADWHARASARPSAAA